MSEHQGLERLKVAAQRFGVQSKKVQARWSGGLSLGVLGTSAESISE